jgi:osmoprotectant transport system ATP-binding protein
VKILVEATSFIQLHILCDLAALRETLKTQDNRMAEPIIDIKNVTKSYQTGAPVLRDVSLAIPKGAFVTIIGPSGCGKTTLLRLINGMTDFDSGKILVMGKDLSDWDKILLRRSIGYVIQHGGLFPHLNVRQNMEFVLNLSKTSLNVVNDRVKGLANMMGFDEMQMDAFPVNLSGGQQQRVGVARALSANPEIVLMDEPFGALDNITRRNLQKEMKTMHQKLGITFVMVTHDLHEAFTLGTQVVIMNEGKIEQFDTPEIISAKPANEWVKEFIAY